METTKEEKNGKSNWRADYAAAMKLREEHTLSPRELSAALDELIDRLDSFLAEAAVKFQIGLHLNQGEWAGEAAVSELIQQLDPHIKVLEDRICEATRGQLQSDALSFASETEKWSYIVGLFMGMRTAGATHAQIEKVKRHVAFSR